MPISRSREAAYQILRRVESGRAFAVDLLQTEQISKLREVDRRLVTELVMGVLRWRGDLDFRIERLSGKPLDYFDPEVATVLRLSIYQIRLLEKIPKAAAVNEAVELVKAARKRSAAGLVNAVLRKCEPAPNLRGAAHQGLTEQVRDWPRRDPEALESACRSLPPWLLERWERHFSPEAARSLAWLTLLTPPTTLRVAGGAPEEIASELTREGIGVRRGKCAPQAWVVESGDVRSSQAWREGCIAIQDEASQLVGALVAPERGQRVLDLCAAPGTKTAQLASALGSGTLVASDLSVRRLRTMARLLRPFPDPLRLHLVRLDATRSLPFGVEFERILVDAPCSGTGTLARNPEIKWRLEQGDLARLAALQAAMLQNALEVLAPGGRLVYVTCSLEPEENERVVEKVLAEEQAVRLVGRDTLAREFPDFAPLFGPDGYFRTRPDLDSMDGFFAAVIVREALG